MNNEEKRSGNHEHKDLLDQNETPKQLGLSRKAVFRQVLMTVLSNLTIISTTMGVSFPAITFNSLTNIADPMAITKDQASWYASIFLIGMPIGSLISSYIVDAIGRRGTLILINVITIISWSLMAASSKTNRDVMYVELLLSRFLTGMATGSSAVSSGLYCAEIVHRNIRGQVLTIIMLIASFGILLSYVWGYFLPNDWRITSWFACAISFVSLVVIVVLVPETPSWLASKARTTQAEKSLRFFKGLSPKSILMNSELRLDIESLHEQSTRRNGADNGSPLAKFQRPEVYKPFVIMLAFFGFQQFSGIFVVIVYTVPFCIAAGVSMDPFLTSVYVGLCRLITTVLVVLLLDTIGRRKMAMFSGFSMFLFMLGIALYLYFEMIIWPWLPVFFLLGYISSSTFGLLILPNTMNSELFPQDVRGVATGLTSAFAFTLSFCVIKIYPSVSVSMGNLFVIIFFTCSSLLSVMFIYYFLPETKGKTFDEIKQLFIKELQTTAELEKL